MTKNLTHSITIGPPIPIVPVTHFKRGEYSQEFYDMAWYIVGPTIHANMARGQTQQHMLYCIAFIEGMRLAASILNDRSLPEILDINRLRRE